MKFYLVDFGCLTRIGHRCNGLESLSIELRKRGYDVLCGINSAATKDLLCDIKALPVTNLKFPTVSDDPLTGDIENFVAHGEVGVPRFREFMNGTTENDVLIFHTVSEVELWVLYCWLVSDKNLKVPRIIANLALPTFFDTTSERLNQRGILMRFVINRLMMNFPQVSIKYFSYTIGLCDLYRELFGVEVALIPNPLELRLYPEVTRERNSNDPIVITSLGRARTNKSPELIVELVKRLVSFGIRFRVQNWPKGLPSMEGVELYEPGLSRSSFEEILISSDICLLIYDQCFYKYGVSAIFEEAIVSGNSVVVSEGTTMHAILDSHPSILGEVVSRSDIDQIEAAVLRLVKILKANNHDFQKQRRCWIENHGVNRYVDILLAILE